MRQVTSERLWIGNAMDVRDPVRLFDTGVEAIVDLAYEEPPSVLPRGLVYCRFPLVDGAGNRPQLLAAAVGTIVALLRRQVPTLVGCGAGMSRAPAVVAAALGIVRGVSPETCLQELIEGHPHDVSPSLWTDIKNAYNELAG